MEPASGPIGTLERRPRRGTPCTSMISPTRVRRNLTANIQCLAFGAGRVATNPSKGAAFASQDRKIGRHSQEQTACGS
jgi:hypothetical protein